MRSLMICTVHQIFFGFKNRRHVARVRKRRGVIKVLVEKSEGKNYLEDPGIDGKVILRWKSRMWDVGL
jgi:hypothetical protein